MANEFTVERVSPAGDVPNITFHVRGDTMRAEMANGAKLYAEIDPADDDHDEGADMRLVSVTGEVLADVRINPRSHINLTENVADVGSALLWSHWRYCEALKAKPIDELIAKSSIGAGLADIKERGVDAHLADVEKGKL